MMITGFRGKNGAHWNFGSGVATAVVVTTVAMLLGVFAST